VDPLTLTQVALKYLTDRLALAGLFMSIASLILMTFHNIADIWLREHWQYPAVVGGFAICYLPTGPIIKRCHEWGARREQTRKQRYELEEKQELLAHLTHGEKTMLAKYVSGTGNVRSRRILASDPIAQGLEDLRILYSPNVGLDEYNQKAYNIHSWAREHLKKHPELLQ
jgi:hypothetical protein